MSAIEEELKNQQNEKIVRWKNQMESSARNMGFACTLSKLPVSPNDIQETLLDSSSSALSSPTTTTNTQVRDQNETSLPSSSSSNKNPILYQTTNIGTRVGRTVQIQNKCCCTNIKIQTGACQNEELAKEE